MTFVWIAFGLICTFYALSVIFSTRRELAWARMALRAMYGEPQAGQRLRAAMAREVYARIAVAMAATSRRAKGEK